MHFLNIIYKHDRLLPSLTSLIWLKQNYKKNKTLLTRLLSVAFHLLFFTHKLAQASKRHYCNYSRTFTYASTMTHHYDSRTCTYAGTQTLTAGTWRAWDTASLSLFRCLGQSNCVVVLFRACTKLLSCLLRSEVTLRFSVHLVSHHKLLYRRRSIVGGGGVVGGVVDDDDVVILFNSGWCNVMSSLSGWRFFPHKKKEEQEKETRNNRW